MASIIIQEVTQGLNIVEQTTTLKLGEYAVFSGDINDLNQIDTASLANGDILQYNSTTGVFENVSEDVLNIEKGTLTKTFTTDEVYNLTLDTDIAGIPIISATKEVASGEVVDSTWNVETTGSDYDVEDFAPAVAITPSATTGNITLTLGSGVWSASNVGMTVSGNGGVAVITSQSGTAVANATVTTDFTDTSSIASGLWTLEGLSFDATNGVQVSNLVTINGYDLSTASYDSKSFSTATQSVSMFKLRIENNGTKLYTCTNANVLYQYTLSTPYDIDTASYDSKSLTASANNYLWGMFLKPDGTKVYLTDNADATVYQYTLSTAWDISTATYDSKSFLFGTQETNGAGIYIKDDGTKLYISGPSTDAVYQYTLSTAWDISTATYDSKSFSVAAQTLAHYDIGFKNDGTKFIVIASSGIMYQYTLSTAWDISTATYDTISFDASANVALAGMSIVDSGSRIYFLNTANDTVYQYSMGSQTITSTSNQYLPAITNATGQVDSSLWLDISSMAVTDVAGGSVVIDLSTGSYDSKSFDGTAQGTTLLASRLVNGSKYYSNSANDGVIHQYTLSVIGDISSASYDTKSFNVTTPMPSTSVASLWVNSSGTKLYALNGTDLIVYQFTMSTPFDISTSSYDSKTLDCSSEDTLADGICFNSSTTRMYFLSRGNDTIYQYDLSVAEDLSSGSYSSKSFSAATQVTDPTELTMINDSTILVTDRTTETVYKYSLSTADDISTCSYSSESFSIATQSLVSRGISYYDSKMYISDQSANTYQYTIGTSSYAGDAYYAISTDGRTTYQIIQTTAGAREIVRNNAGTWEYNSNATYGSTTWTPATTNTEFQALSEAMSVAANKMTGTQLAAILDAEHFTLGDTLDRAVILYTSDATVVPSSKNGTINYVAQATDVGAIHGTDYTWTKVDNSTVQITALTAGNYKVKVV